MAVHQRLSFMLSGAQLGITVTSLVLGFIAEPAIATVIEPALDRQPPEPDGKQQNKHNAQPEARHTEPKQRGRVGGRQVGHRGAARDLIERAGGVVKIAIVMHFLDTDRADAERALEAAGGIIRKAIGRNPPPVQ